MEFTPEKIFQLEALSQELGVQDFDLMLVGDGSGTTCRTPCGFACVAYNRFIKQGSIHYGGFNHGTNNFAELMPYVHAMWHHWSINNLVVGPGRIDQKVLIVSDSEVTVRQGTRQYRREGNACLWASIDWFEENGFRFIWKHVRRNTNPISTECDHIAGKVRKHFIEPVREA